MPKAQSQTQKNQLKDKKVILCETNDKVSKVIKGIMLAIGIKLIPAEDGEQVLDIQQSEKIDMLIIDENMAKLSPFELIDKIGKFQTKIILLSAKPTKALVMKAIDYGMSDVVAKHTFDIPRFAKRIVCELGFDKVGGVVERSLSMEDDDNDTQKKKMIDLVDKKINLDALPTFANEILQLTLKEDVEIKELEQNVSLDPALTTQLLRVVNSPNYRGHVHLTKVSDAIKRLGLQKLRQLVLAMKMKDELSQQSDYIDGMELFKLNILVAVAARKLYQHCGDYPNEDVAFTAGLIHNVGMLMLHKVIGEDYYQVVDQAISRGRSQTVFEQRYFTTDYISASKKVLESWKIPSIILQTIENHRATYDKLIRQEYIDSPLVMSINLGYLIAISMNLTQCGLESFKIIDPKLFQALKIENKTELMTLIKEIKSQFQQDVSLLCGNEPSKSYALKVSRKINLVTCNADLTSLHIVFPFELNECNTELDERDSGNPCIFYIHDKQSYQLALTVLNTLPDDLSCVVLTTEKYLNTCKTHMTHPKMLCVTDFYLRNFEI